MEIKDLQPNTGNIDIVAVVTEKEEPRTFEKFGKSGRVCNAKIKDDTGEVKLTLWNEDIDKVNVGDKIHLDKGWCSEFRDEKQLSTGKFGKVEVVAAATKDAADVAGAAPENVAAAEQAEDNLKFVDEEEVVE